MKCKKCGYTIKNNQKYCDNCGEPVEKKPFGAFEVVTLVLTALFNIIFIVCFLFDWPNKSVAFFQMLLTVLAFLVKRDVIDSSIKNMEKILLIVALVLIIPFCLSIPWEEEQNISPINNKNDWSNVMMADVIDDPLYGEIDIIINRNDYLYVDIDEYSAVDYQQYLDSCIQRGFIYEAQLGENSYSAYNEEGYFLQLNYYQYSEGLAIDLIAPVQYNRLYWPSSPLADLLPVAECEFGEVRQLTEDNLDIFLADMTKDEYAQYVDRCITQGFSEGIIRTEKSFVGKDEAGNLLKISYCGFNQVLIELTAAQYEVSIIVTAQASFLAKYDVEIYVDDLYQTMVGSSDSRTILINLKEGIHTIKFVCYDDDDLSTTAVFEVKNNSVLQYNIKCSLFSLIIEGQNQSESSGINLGEFLTWYQSSDTDYEYALVNYGVVDSYYLIDTNDNTVICFTDGSLLVMPGTFTKLSDTEITVAWNHGLWQEKLSYDSENRVVVVSGIFGSESEYYICEVQQALEVLTQQQ
ncbi:MAG: DUF6591 domain-containing protein [Erysipelotrichaceae bacterium]